MRRFLYCEAENRTRLYTMGALDVIHNEYNDQVLFWRDEYLTLPAACACVVVDEAVAFVTVLELLLRFEIPLPLRYSSFP